MLTNFLRNTFYASPEWIKKIYGSLPYRLKFGKKYSKELKLIRESYNWSVKDYNTYINRTLVELVHFAYKNIEFYKEFYDQHGVNISQIQTVSDFEKLPIVTKQILKETDFNIRSKKANKFNSYRTNTGGSSGEPFTFLLPKKQYYRAWAYKADMWGRAGYEIGDPVLSFRGHKFSDKLYSHQPVYNFYNVDSYKLDSKNLNSLLRLIENKGIEFIHGYPSNIVNFLSLIDDYSNLNVKGILPCSEKFDEQKKEFIKKRLNVKLQPSYEQSEMTILASYGEETDKYYFYPTYGYPELVSNSKTVSSANEKGRLIGTSFDNEIMPLIRYETGDEAIWSENNEEKFKNFKCAEYILGRVGEYIRIGNNKISVTGLIYGQHLPIFDMSNQIQLYQNEGKLFLFYVSNKSRINEIVIQETREKLRAALSGKLQVRVIQIAKPIKTESGKSKILIGDESDKQIKQIIEKKG